MTMARIHYRLFDQHIEDPEPIFKMYEIVYGDSAPIRRRWSWEFLNHPESEDVKIYVAENQGALVGMTVRMPCTLLIGGKTKRAFFATNSLVRPEHRGQGIIRGLYDLAARNGDIQLSKGTAPAMYTVLQKIGYREIVPSNYLVCLLAPHKWAMGKIFKTIRFRTRETFSDMRYGEFIRLCRFSEEHEALVLGAITVLSGGVVKDIRTLNWRYLEIPHRSYHVFARKCSNETVSMLVLRLEGLTAYIVDLRWTELAHDEPARSIKFAKTFARKMGAVKLVFWGTLEKIRYAMRKQSFIGRTDSPRFSFYSANEDFHSVKWAGLHFVHGDGDMEYL